MDSISKNDLNLAMTKIDRRFDAVEKRFDTLESRIATMTVRLEHKIEEEVIGLAAMITKGFADIEKRLDVKDRVETLEKKMTRVESALNVQL